MLKLCSFLAGALLLAGCTAETTVVPGAGSLVVDWTVSGTKDPAECDASGATDLDVVVRSGGALIGDFVSDCRDFSQSITLGPGSYEADAVLLDAGGNDRTTTVPVGPFQIFGGDTVVVPINFPASSFF